MEEIFLQVEIVSSLHSMNTLNEKGREESSSMATQLHHARHDSDSFCPHY
jgi:hypothetical protein